MNEADREALRAAFAEPTVSPETITIDAEAWKAFTAALDEASPENARLRAMLSRKAPWDKSGGRKKT